MERCNRARTENIGRSRCVRKNKFERNKDGGIGGRNAGDFFEADALVAQFRMGKLFLRWRFLAQVGNCMRERRLLC